MYFAWFLFLFEPEWFLASFGLEALKRAMLLTFPALLAIAIFKRGRPRVYWPMAMFLVLHTVTLPFVTNRGYAMEPWKLLLQVCVLCAASLATIDSIRRALPLVAMYLFHFAWWSLHGLPQGTVFWHYALGDQDGYGAIMGLGLGYAIFVGMGRQTKRSRTVAGLIAALCGIGVVASFARGAFLAAGLVLFVGWLRSPRRVAMAGALLLVGFLGLIAAEVLFPEGAYWAEMKTIQDGYADQTGSDRRILWDAAWRVFLMRPLFGVGASNFGPYAAENFHRAEAAGRYEDPVRLYGRSLHSIYYQLLAEQGLVGCGVFLWILIDFARRNRVLRRPEVVARWSRMTDGRSDLRVISLGLEAALVAYLANGFFYHLLYMGDLYALLVLNVVLSAVARGGAAAVSAQSSQAGGRSGAAACRVEPAMRPVDQAGMCRHASGTTTSMLHGPEGGVGDGSVVSPRG